MTFFKHVTVLSGVGVGGGSSGVCKHPAHPIGAHFFGANLVPFGPLGARTGPPLSDGPQDARGCAQPAAHVRRRCHFPGGRRRWPKGYLWPHHGGGVFWATGRHRVPDPYFEGAGPPRTGCTSCGGCMLGCRVGAKNTLDKNYLYLAEQKGLVIAARNPGHLGRAGWRWPVTGWKPPRRHRWGRTRRRTLHAKQVVFRRRRARYGAPLIAPARGGSMASRSSRTGWGISCAPTPNRLVGVVSPNPRDMSRGLAIGSIMHTPENGSLEPVRYPAGSGLFSYIGPADGHRCNLAAAPCFRGDGVYAHALGVLCVHCSSAILPSSHSYLLYMRAMEGHLRMQLGRDPYIPAFSAEW